MGGAPSVPTDPSRRIQVIGAGYSRTGTLSMQLALEKLLNGPVMHGGTQILHREDAYMKKLVHAYELKRQGDTVSLHKLLEEIFAGFVGCTDMPPIDFIPDLLELYPDAKVVLTTRDPEKWAKSLRPVSNNVSLWWLPYVMWPVPGWRWFPTLVREFSTSSKKFLQPAEAEQDPYLALLQNWNRAVQEMVPAERLLIMDLKDGWGPLCKFLDVPVPNEPMPRANDSASAEKTAQDVIRTLMGIWAGIIGTFGILSFATWKAWKSV